MLGKLHSNRRNGCFDPLAVATVENSYTLPSASLVGVDAIALNGRAEVCGMPGQWCHARFAIAVGGGAVFPPLVNEWLDIVFELYGVVGNNLILLDARTPRQATHRIENGTVYADVLWTDPGGFVCEGFRVKARCDGTEIPATVRQFFSLWCWGDDGSGGPLPEWTTVSADGIVGEAQLVAEPCHASMVYVSSNIALGGAVRFMMLFDTTVAIPAFAVPPITSFRLPAQGSRSVSLGGRGIKFDAGLRIGISTAQRTFGAAVAADASATAWIRTP